MSFPLEGRDTTPYMSALSREIERRAPKYPRTIFIGGGTPSILNLKSLEVFFEHLESTVSFRSHSEEISFECNPESLDLEKCRLLKQLGVTRLSIGVQSFEEKYLRFYDRAHSAEQARRAYESAREAGFDNINLDLIFGAPEQSLEEWKKDLESAIELRPDHIAAYDLIFEPGTVLHQWKLSGRVSPNPEDLQAQMYQHSMARLREAGYLRYETSNYALGDKTCLHNLNYWKNGEYVGVGAGAVSYENGVRSKNSKNLTDYLERCRETTWSFIEQEKLGPKQSLGETMMLRLRLSEGVCRAEVQLQTGMDFFLVYAEELGQLQSEGLVDLSPKTLRLTEKGEMLGDLVASRFLL